MREPSRVRRWVGGAAIPNPTAPRPHGNGPQTLIFTRTGGIMTTTLSKHLVQHLRDSCRDTTRANHQQSTWLCFMRARACRPHGSERHVLTTLRTFSSPTDCFRHDHRWTSHDKLPVHGQSIRVAASPRTVRRRRLAPSDEICGTTCFCSTHASNGLSLDARRISPIGDADRCSRERARLCVVFRSLLGSMSSIETSRPISTRLHACQPLAPSSRVAIHRAFEPRARREHHAIFHRWTKSHRNPADRRGYPAWES